MVRISWSGMGSWKEGIQERGVGYRGEKAMNGS